MSHRQNPDPHKWHVIGMTITFIVTLPVIVLAIVWLRPEPPVSPWVEAAEELGVTPIILARGETTFQRTCVVCHGADATGVPRIGKPLRNSEFVQTHSDEEIFDLIANGRPPTDPANTTGIDMPPRGAQNIIDYEVHSVVQYLRTLQEPGAEFASLEGWLTPVVPPPPPTPPPAPVQTASLAADEKAQTEKTDGETPAPKPTPPPAPVPPPSAGHSTFVAFCSACHGPSGEGLPNLGKPLAKSAFVQSKSDKDLVTFIKTGRPIWDPENTTGIDMPPKGGNPALSDAQIDEIVSFIRAIQ